MQVGECPHHHTIGFVKISQLDVLLESLAAA
jgi:hypothetical protein